jgi:hypothetical protein
MNQIIWFLVIWREADRTIEETEAGDARVDGAARFPSDPKLSAWLLL